MKDENMPDQLPLKVRSHLLLISQILQAKSNHCNCNNCNMRVLLEAEKCPLLDLIWAHELVCFFGFGNTHWFESDF